MATSVLTKVDAWQGNIPVLWHLEFRHVNSDASPLILEWSTVGIADPATYSGGWKAPRVSKFTSFVRKLSDRFGRLETSSAVLTLGDVDHLVRSWMTDPNQQSEERRVGK